MRDLEGPERTPSTRSELVHRCREIVDAEHGDGAFALQMVGKQDERRALGQLDRRYACPHAVDREANASTEHVFEDDEVGGDVATRRVQEVQGKEERFGHEKCPHRIVPDELTLRPVRDPGVSASVPCLPPSPVPSDEDSRNPTVAGYEASSGTGVLVTLLGAAVRATWEIDIWTRPV